MNERMMGKQYRDNKEEREVKGGPDRVDRTMDDQQTHSVNTSVIIHASQSPKDQTYLSASSSFPPWLWLSFNSSRSHFSPPLPLLPPHLFSTLSAWAPFKHKGYKKTQWKSVQPWNDSQPVPHHLLPLLLLFPSLSSLFGLLATQEAVCNYTDDIDL